MKNWSILLEQRDSNLPNIEPYFLIKYGEPVEIKFDKNLKLKFESDYQYKEIKIPEKHLNSSVSKNRNLPQFIHKEFENGEYKLLKDNNLEICKVKIKFMILPSFLKNLNNLLFWKVIDNKIKSEFANQNFCDISIDYSCSFRNSIQFEGSEEKVLEYFNLIWNEFKDLKISNYEIEDAKNDLIADMKRLYENPITIEILDHVLLHSLKNISLSVENFIMSFHKIWCNFYKNYYVMIEASGNIDEKSIEHIFNTVKSTGTKELSLCPIIQENRVELKTIDSSTNGILISFEIEKKYSTCKMYAMINILELIMQNPFYSYVRLESRLSYSSNIDLFRFSNNFFISFFIKSSEKIENIEKNILVSSY